MSAGGTSLFGPLSLEVLRADLAAALDIPEGEILDDDNLVDLGLDSIRLMVLTRKWNEAGATVDFATLAEYPQLEHWWTLTARQAGRDGASRE